MHAATSLGLYRLESGHFQEIATDIAPCWSLLVYRTPEGSHRLLVGTQDGVYDLANGAVRLIVPASNAFVLHASRHHPEIVYVGDLGGVRVLRFADDRWLDEGRLQNLEEEVRSIAEDEAGRLWLGTHFDGLIRARVYFEPDLRLSERVRLGRERGLLTLRSVKIESLFGRLVFSTPEGLYRFDPSTKMFEPDDSLGSRFTTPDGAIFRLSPDREGNIWISLYTQENVIALQKPDDTFAIDDQSLRRITDRSLHTVLPEGDGVVWFGGVEGLYRFDFGRQSLPGASRRSPRSVLSMPATLIRRVSVAQRVVFDGAGGSAAEPPTLSYSHDTVRFEYALPRFDANEGNRYRSRLAGLDDVWSDWTDETYRNFTSLREGRYRFEIEGRDVYHRRSEVAAFDLRVLPPWYRSWWAYALYALALAASTGGISAWQLRRVRLGLELQRLAEGQRHDEANRRRTVAVRPGARNQELRDGTFHLHRLSRSEEPLDHHPRIPRMLEKDLAKGREERVERDIARIRTATGKMVVLLNDLLNLSRTGRVTNEPREVSLGELAREAAEQVAGRIAERRVEVSIALIYQPSSATAIVFRRCSRT